MKKRKTIFITEMMRVCDRLEKNIKQNKLLFEINEIFCFCVGILCVCERDKELSYANRITAAHSTTYKVKQ